MLQLRQAAGVYKDKMKTLVTYSLWIEASGISYLTTFFFFIYLQQKELTAVSRELEKTKNEFKEYKIKAQMALKQKVPGVSSVPGTSMRLHPSGGSLHAMEVGVAGVPPSSSSTLTALDLSTVTSRHALEAMGIEGVSESDAKGRSGDDMFLCEPTVSGVTIPLSSEEGAISNLRTAVTLQSLSEKQMQEVTKYCLLISLSLSFLHIL
jgi:hypothetical protein